MTHLDIKGFKGLISVLSKNKQAHASNYWHCVLSDSQGILQIWRPFLAVSPSLRADSGIMKSVICFVLSHWWGPCEVRSDSPCGAVVILGCFLAALPTSSILRYSLISILRGGSQFRVHRCTLPLQITFANTYYLMFIWAKFRLPAGCTIPQSIQMHLECLVNLFGFYSLQQFGASWNLWEEIRQLLPVAHVMSDRVTEAGLALGCRKALISAGLYFELSALNRFQGAHPWGVHVHRDMELSVSHRP